MSSAAALRTSIWWRAGTGFESSSRGFPVFEFEGDSLGSMPTTSVSQVFLPILLLVALGSSCSEAFACVVELLRALGFFLIGIYCFLLRTRFSISEKSGSAVAACSEGNCCQFCLNRIVCSFASSIEC